MIMLLTLVALGAMATAVVAAQTGKHAIQLNSPASFPVDI